MKVVQRTWEHEGHRAQEQVHDRNITDTLMVDKVKLMPCTHEGDEGKWRHVGTQLDLMHLMTRSETEPDAYGTRLTQ